MEGSGKGTGTGTGTATGCYKCGRPGHWSRDCPFSAPDSNPNTNTNTDTAIPNRPPSSSSFKPPGPRSAIEKPKKLPRTRPKLTPDLLLSDDGLGYILRYFPQSFKYHGPGHEVRDLGNLLELYSEWHSRLLPYFPFNQFVNKVEKVAATRRVKTSLRELRERVASGGDPSKLREAPVVHDIPDDGQEVGEASHREREAFGEPENANDIQEDMFNDMFDKATEEPSQPMHNATENTSNEVPNNGASLSSKDEITAEQRARMQANRLKALERRAAPVASGGDPSKLREVPIVHNIPDDGQEVGEASHQERDVFGEPKNANDIQEDMFNDIFDKATEEPSQPMHISTENTSSEVPNNGTSLSSKDEITAEQRARMEANRLKALERRAARASLP